MAVYKVTVDEATTVLGVTEAVTILSEQVTGVQGATGQGLATGGTTNQVLAKNSNTNFDTKWIDAGGGGGSGTVTSVATGTGLTGGPITTSGTLSLADVSPAPTGTYGSATAVPAITVDVKGRTTAVTSTPIQLASTAKVTGLDTALANKAPSTGIAQSAITGLVSALSDKANTGSTNTFTNNQTIQGNLTVGNGAGTMVFDASVGTLTLDTGSLTVLNTITSSGVIQGAQLRVGTGAGNATLSPTGLTASRAITFPDKDITVAGAGANTDITSLTGLTTATASGLITGGSIKVGTGAGNATLSSTGLTASRSVIFPDKDITIAGAGANTDITSLTGLTTALSTSQGGTGVTGASTGTGGVVLSTNPVITKPTITRAVYQNVAPSTLTWTSNAATIASSVLTAGWMQITDANLSGSGTLNLPSTTICAAFLTTNGEAADITIINLDPLFGATLTAVSGVTLLGNAVVAAGTSATFRFYRTSATVFVWVRTA